MERIADVYRELIYFLKQGADLNEAGTTNRIINALAAAYGRGYEDGEVEGKKSLLAEINKNFGENE